MDKGVQNVEVARGEWEGESHLFLVRLWAAGVVEGRFEWHGKVQHVTKGGSYTFSEWSMLLDFLTEMLPKIEAARSEGTELSDTGESSNRRQKED